jgi:hypothetical protein
MTIESLSSPSLAASPGSCQAPLLVVAHPGHELRILGWMEQAAPRVCVLTDGSGSAGEGRLSSTTRVLERTGSRAGGVYGRLSDRDLYAALLAGDHAAFLRLADDLAGVIATNGIDCVVGDAIEGYNPSHDVCRLIVNAAIRMTSPAGKLPSYDYLLVGPPAECPEELRASAYTLELSDEQLQRKLEAARCYPELAGEVDAALARFGLAPFRTECMRPSDPAERYGWDAREVPYYERYGEERVAAGVYRDVIRFGEHIRPLADALWEHSERHG